MNVRRLAVVVNPRGGKRNGLGVLERIRLDPDWNHSSRDGKLGCTAFAMSRRLCWVCGFCRRWLADSAAARSIFP